MYTGTMVYTYNGIQFAQGISSSCEYSVSQAQIKLQSANECKYKQQYVPHKLVKLRHYKQHCAGQ